MVVDLQKLALDILNVCGNRGNKLDLSEVESCDLSVVQVVLAVNNSLDGSGQSQKFINLSQITRTQMADIGINL